MQKTFKDNELILINLEVIFLKDRYYSSLPEVFSFSTIYQSLSCDNKIERGYVEMLCIKSNAFS